ncbi:MAG: DNA-binding NtrC family response regulator [Desulforhopalus sp.]|jgi:DNA-binding NtrC family response regulator
MTMYKILIFDRLGKTRTTLTSALEDRAKFTIITSESEFQDEIKSKQFDLIFLDHDLMNGRAVKLLESMRNKDPYLPIIMTSETEKAEIIVRAMNSGASDFLIHPISSSRVKISFDKAIEIRDQRFEIAYHRRKQDVVYDFKDVVAFSPKMKAILVSLERFANTDSTILITGDTGTGKSFLSGTIHFNSPRREKPFVKINCANIPVDLLESELFGHEKGAFTGADKQRIGRFEQASGGTIFLDEIGEMNLGLQTKLLRVLEEKSFERVGGNKTIYSDVRIIAATNKNLVKQVADGHFREDLYYRINVLPVTLPSLRDRQECLMPLAELLLNKCCTSMHRKIIGFTDDSRAKIESYDWPGNIRQLANTIERAVILEDGKHIHSENLALPERVMRNHSSTADMNKQENVDHFSDGELNGSLAGQEKDLILRVLEECLWVQKNAAEKLGVSPRALNYKINKLGITHPHWRRNKGSN